MPIVMVALPNIGSALCSTPQNLADAHYHRCRAVTLPWRETSWNLQGCPNSRTDHSRYSGPKFTILWGHVEDILLLNNFFPIVNTCLSCDDIADKVVRWCLDGDFLRPVFPASRVQHVSDVHLKFALRPRHVWKYGRHPISDCWD